MQHRAKSGCYSSTPCREKPALLSQETWPHGRGLQRTFMLHLATFIVKLYSGFLKLLRFLLHPAIAFLGVADLTLFAGRISIGNGHGDQKRACGMISIEINVNIASSVASNATAEIINGFPKILN